MKRKLTLVVFLILHFSVQSKYLTDNNEKFVNEVRFLIQNLEAHLSYLKWKLKDYEREERIRVKESFDYMNNPLNVFSMIVRLTDDSSIIQTGILDVVDNFHSRVKDLAPAKKELAGIVDVISKMQRIYNIRTKDLSSGIIDGHAFKSIMSPKELNVFGGKLFESGKVSLSVEYFVEALRQNRLQRKYLDISDFDIMVNLIYAFEMNGNYNHAITVVDEMLEQGLPDHPEDFTSYRDSLKSSIQMGEVFKAQKTADPPEINILKDICREGNAKRKTSKLHCYYEALNLFTKIAPFKMEEISIYPPIKVYYDVLSDQEIDELSISLTRDSRNFRIDIDRDTADLLKVEVAWLDDAKIRASKKISRRVEDMTNFKSVHAEKLQILNYGVGGFHEDHYNLPEYTVDTRNRKAVVSFFMTNIEKGGEILFPQLKIMVPVTKGSAVFWHNFGTTTQYTACPVLIGAKQIAVKWLH